MTSAGDPEPMSRTSAILYAIGLPLALLALVFLPAGRIDWIAGWIFIAVLVAAFSLSALLLARLNPVIYRARSRFQPGTERWDLILLAVMLPAFVAEVPLATLDAGRMRWSDVPSWAVFAGYALLLGGIAVTTWTQAVNPFFEPGVRIQKERAQRVITSGPYRLVRHPGYTAAIAMFVGVPLALASWWALLPAVLAVVLLIVRTRWEDRLLQAELSAYARLCAPNAVSAPARLLVTPPRQTLMPSGGGVSEIRIYGRTVARLARHDACAGRSRLIRVGE